MEQQREKSFILFQNDKKTKQTQPDWTGRITIDGVEHWISMWEKRGKKGVFYTGSIGDPVQKSIDNAKQASQGGGQSMQGSGGNEQPQQSYGGGGQFEDDIPFAGLTDAFVL